MGPPFPQEKAREAYSRRDFGQALELVDRLVVAQPGSPRWREMRAAALVDGKAFRAALGDYGAALEGTPPDGLVDRARLLAGRALAWEGLAEWGAALADYDAALLTARQAGQFADPYVLNSRGNVLASLGRWQGARADAQLQ